MFAHELLVLRSLNASQKDLLYAEDIHKSTCLMMSIAVNCLLLFLSFSPELTNNLAAFSRAKETWTAKEERVS